MTIEACVPDEELKSRVESIVIVRSREGMINTLPPNTAPVLAFRLRGTTAERIPYEEKAVPRLGITGLIRTPRVMHFHPQSEMLLVRFRDGGAAGFTKTPMDELAGTSVGLDVLMAPRVVHEIEQRLDEAPNDARRVAIIQDFLKSRLSTESLDPLVGSAIESIRHSRGTLRIRELARDLATNPDTLEKRFRSLVGATPKLFSRIVRFQSFVNTYSTENSLTDAALQAGFYDQAHLIKEFRTFTGKSPSEFFLHPRNW